MTAAEWAASAVVIAIAALVYAARRRGTSGGVTSR
jgi:hypothetical protein